MTTNETKKSRRVSRWAAVGAVLSVGAVLGYAIRAAHASGIPSTQALTYAGVLEDGTGAALTGVHNIQVAVFDAATTGNLLCQMATAQSVTLANGRLVVSLPDACAASFGSKSDTWVDVAVDGASTGRSKVGVVPYAVEAGHATVSATASNVTSNLQMITASVTGTDIAASRTSSDVACPVGYSLVMASVGTVQLMQNGVNGWPNGVYGCSNVAGNLRASLTQYAGTGATELFSCVGLCAK